MTKSLKNGDNVKWNSHGGEARGKPDALKKDG